MVLHIRGTHCPNVHGRSEDGVDVFFQNTVKSKITQCHDQADNSVNLPCCELLKSNLSFRLKCCQRVNWCVALI
jgi:hypothetical protein